MRRAYMPVSAELLLEALHLPKETKLLGIDESELFVNGTLRLHLEHPDLPNLVEGERSTEIKPEFESEYLEVPPIVRMTSWGRRK